MCLIITVVLQVGHCRQLDQVGRGVPCFPFLPFLRHLLAVQCHQHHPVCVCVYMLMCMCVRVCVHVYVYVL